jgi:hypothetical protein
MGTLIYGHDYQIALDDRTLSHLQIAMGLKLRRREGFFLTWNEADAGTQRRCCVWIDPAIPLLFLYEDSAAPSINREWLEQLTQSSNSARGLQVIREPAESV